MLMDCVYFGFVLFVSGSPKERCCSSQLFRKNQGCSRCRQVSQKKTESLWLVRDLEFFLFVKQ